MISGGYTFARRLLNTADIWIVRAAILSIKLFLLMRKATQ
jgi:hypothetical protein